MKRKELIMLGSVAVVAAFFAYILAGILFGSPKKNAVLVPAVTPISSNLPITNNDATYKSIFNSQAIDPTQLIRVGGQTNPQPFTGQQ